MKTVLLLLATTFLETVPLVGQSVDTTARNTLRGLTRIHVVIESVDRDAEHDGLSTDQIQTDVELRLRQAGIPIGEFAEMSREEGLPYLYVNVQTLKSETGLYAYHLEVQLSQIVSLVRDRSVVMAKTWEARAQLGVVGKNRLSSVREDIRDMVDQFINAFLAANPKLKPF